MVGERRRLFLLAFLLAVGIEVVAAAQEEGLDPPPHPSAPAPAPATGEEVVSETDPIPPPPNADAIPPPPPGYLRTVLPAGAAPAPLPPSQPLFVPPAPAAGPVQMETVERHRIGLIVAGAVTFGVSYYISALIAGIDYDEDGEFDGTGSLLIPVIGPLLTLSETDSEAVDLFLIGDAIAQAAGLAMLVVGIFVPVTEERPVIRQAGEWTLSPQVGRRNGAMATFWF